MINLKQFEYGILGVLLNNAPGLSDVEGVLTNELTGDSSVSSIILTLASAPIATKAGIWLTGNNGNYQRLEYKSYSDNTDGTYTFTLDRLTTIKTTVAAATQAFVELGDLPIFEYGSIIESSDYDFIQVMVEKPEKEFPGICGDAANLWKLRGMVVVVDRIKQDEKRLDLSGIYSELEYAFIQTMTAVDLSFYSDVKIMGLLEQESEDGKWDKERQGLACEMEIKYHYSQSAGSAPVFTVDPTISGDTLLGEELTCDSGTTSGDEPITIDYQWQRDGVDILGATAATRTTTAPDVGRSIGCVVTATNVFGEASATTNTLMIERLWTFADIASELNLDASDTDTVQATAGSVDRWLDKSGNDRHATASGGNRPVDGETINSLNAIDFANTKTMEVLDVPPMTSGGSMSLVVVNDPDPTAVARRYFAARQSGGSRFYLDASAAYQHGGTFNTVSTTYQSGVQIYMGYRDNAEKGVGYYGDYATETEAFTAPALDDMFISSLGGTGSFSNSIIGEILITDYYDFDDRQRIEGLAAHKWGDPQSLIAGHPYIDNPPTITTPYNLTQLDGYYVIIDGKYQTINGDLV